MDGLSAAGSGMAVISMAVQLVSSINDIRKFLGRVSDAPKELNRLIDVLEQLELILQHIGTMIEKQRGHSLRGEIDVSPSVLRAIKACENRVQILEEVVETAKRTSFSANKSTRTLGAFKLACKKKEIEEFESQVLNTISILHLAMTTNLTFV